MTEKRPSIVNETRIPSWLVFVCCAAIAAAVWGVKRFIQTDKPASETLAAVVYSSEQDPDAIEVQFAVPLDDYQRAVEASIAELDSEIAAWDELWKPLLESTEGRKLAGDKLSVLKLLIVRLEGSPQKPFLRHTRRKFQKTQADLDHIERFGYPLRWDKADLDTARSEIRGQISKAAMQRQKLKNIIDQAGELELPTEEATLGEILKRIDKALP